MRSLEVLGRALEFQRRSALARAGPPAGRNFRWALLSPAAIWLLQKVVSRNRVFARWQQNRKWPRRLPRFPVTHRGRPGQEAAQKANASLAGRQWTARLAATDGPTRPSRAWHRASGRWPIAAR